MSKRLFLVDGTALAYRSHHAFTSRGGGLSTSDGRPTGAAFGTIQTLRMLLDREKPEYAAVAFDGPREDLHRTAVYPEYKSTRKKAPEEMVAQLDAIRRATEALGLPVVEKEGFEADDVLGTLAVQGAAEGMEVFIVTGDKDFAQLAGDRVRLYMLRPGGAAPEVLDAKGVEARFGLPPRQVVDWLALMGDSSDNVPGARGVGDKTARELLRKYGSLGEVLAHADEVPRKNVREGLLAHRDQAETSRRLVTIDTSVPLEVGPRGLRVRPPDTAALRALYADLEFRSLLKSLSEGGEAEQEQDYRVVGDAEALEALLEGLRGAEAFAVDTETTSLDTLDASVVGVSFSWEEGKAFYVPLNLDPPLLEGGREEVLRRLAGVLAGPRPRKVGQNMKFDYSVLLGEGVELQGLWFDTMLASYVVAPGLRPHNLDALVLDYFGYRKIPTSEVIGSGKGQTTMDLVPVEKVGRYACEDADFTWRLHLRLAEELAQKGLDKVFREIEMPLVPVLARMERNGIALDTAHLAELSRRMERRIEELTRAIHEAAGEAFNINSNQQLGTVLFEKLKVHQGTGVRPRRTRTGLYATDAGVLEALSSHPVCRLLLEYRTLAKLKGTYVDALPGLVHKRTGRVHTSFNQAVAATGRLSSDNPNLQNIPIRTPEGKEVRKAFVARDGDHRLLSADYSQIELRILAHLSRDPALVEAFQVGEDIHRRTAALLHGTPPAEVTPEMRDAAKAINYGLMYGMGPARLASETGMTVSEARAFIEAYFQKLPAVKRYLDGAIQQARREKAVSTLFGRRRPLPDIDREDARVRANAENMAVNTPLQGTAADLIKVAMVRIDARLAREGFQALMLLQVHDELLFECPAEEMERLRAMVVEEMEGAAELEVPLVVDTGAGRNWLEAH